MKNQVLFSSQDKSEILKCRLLQFLFGALRVKLFDRYDHRLVSVYPYSAKKHSRKCSRND